MSCGFLIATTHGSKGGNGKFPLQRRGYLIKEGGWAIYHYYRLCSLEHENDNGPLTFSAKTPVLEISGSGFLAQKFAQPFRFVIANLEYHNISLLNWHCYM